MAAAAITVAVAVVLIYGLLDPSSTPFPRCPFLALTGWQCPGCGSQRAIHALLHADIAAAWRFNAMMTASIPLLLLLGVADLTRSRWPRFHARLNSLPVILTIFILIVAWWILRNII